MSWELDCRRCLLPSVCHTNIAMRCDEAHDSWIAFAAKQIVVSVLLFVWRLLFFVQLESVFFLANISWFCFFVLFLLYFCSAIFSAITIFIFGILLPVRSHEIVIYRPFTWLIQMWRIKLWPWLWERESAQSAKPTEHPTTICVWLVAAQFMSSTISNSADIILFIIYLLKNWILNNKRCINRHKQSRRNWGDGVVVVVSLSLPRAQNVHYYLKQRSAIVANEWRSTALMQFMLCLTQQTQTFHVQFCPRASLRMRQNIALSQLELCSS